MKRALWLTAGLCLLLCGLILFGVGLPWLQHQLLSQAQPLLASLDTGHGPVQLRFEGLRAVLTGQVRHARQRDELARLIHDRLGLPGGWLPEVRPVLGLRNELVVVPYPPGWLALAVSGRHAELCGRLGTEIEARDAERLLSQRWLTAGGRVQARVTADPARFDEAPDFAATLNGSPTPPAADGPDSAQLHLARAGGGWTRLPPEVTEERLREQRAAFGLQDADWPQVRLLLERVRRTQELERARLAEARRQAGLPPPHLLLAARGDRLLVRGEVASLGLKRGLLNALIEALPAHRVLDDLRVNPERRSVTPFEPVPVEELPPPAATDDNRLLLGVPGAGWHILPPRADAASLETAWRKPLPADLPPERLADDVRMAADWLRGDARGIPDLPVPAQPSFLTLALLPDRVILAGQLAEEPHRARLLEAVRRAYAGRAVLLTDGLLARGTCSPAASVEQTARSLPPLPRAGEPARLGFARPGEVWRSVKVDAALLEPGGLGTSGLLPAGFPAAMAELSLLDAFEILRANRQSGTSGGL
jgi:hypothetical protein